MVGWEISKHPRDLETVKVWVYVVRACSSMSPFPPYLIKSHPIPPYTSPHPILPHLRPQPHVIPPIPSLPVLFRPDLPHSSTACSSYPTPFTPPHLTPPQSFVLPLQFCLMLFPATFKLGKWGSFKKLYSVIVTMIVDFFLWDRVSLWSPGSPRIYYVDQDNLEFIEIHLPLTPESWD